MAEPRLKTFFRNSIRFRALCCLFVSILVGFGLAFLINAVLRRLNLMPADPNGQVGLMFSLATILTCVILGASLSFVLKPIAALNARLQQQKIRSQIGQVDPGEFVELAPLVETLIEYVKWAESQQHMSAAIHHAFRQRIENLAEYDTLTGLYNRHYLEVVLPMQIELVATVNDSLSLIMLDVDNFKHYNDTNGHPEGDKVLAKIADILRTSVREHDICCRYGGEEFCVVLPSANGKIAFAIAERIRRAVEAAPFQHEEKQPSRRITASLGLASFPLEATAPRELIEFADRAMYLAKRRGRNLTCTYAETRDPAADEDLDVVGQSETGKTESES